MDNSLTQSQAREVFLQHATSIDDWNTRAVFYELVHIPTQDDIEVYCKGKLIERWKVRPQYGGFFWHCEDTNRTDYTTVYSKADVRNTYFKQIEALEKRISAFQEQDGRAKLSELAKSPGLEDEQKALLMLDYRSTERIPTKEPIALDENGRVVCAYQKRRVFRGEKRLLEAAGLA